MKQDTIEFVNFICNPKLIKRFWNKVNKTETCWQWQASIFTNGYGQFLAKAGLTMKTHRIAWIIGNNNFIPNDKIIMHICDNKLCVNPLHLKLGTPQENTLDSVAKGRWYKPPERLVCNNGHPLSEGNFYLDHANYKVCLICDRERWYTRKQKNNDKILAYRKYLKGKYFSPKVNHEAITV